MAVTRSEYRETAIFNAVRSKILHVSIQDH